MLLALGSVLVAFCGYQLWGTGFVADHRQAAGLARLQREWDTVAPPGRASPAAAGRKPAPSGYPGRGEAFAVLRIPRLGANWREPVLEGVGARQLAGGIGHYPGTALPGAVGNVALAGHRATHGAPFADLDRIRPGDAIVLETRTATYTYVVTRPWFLVQPTAVQVIAPVTGSPGVAPTGRALTLTTCNPRWASTSRLIVDAALRSTAPRLPVTAQTPQTPAPGRGRMPG